MTAPSTGGGAGDRNDPPDKPPADESSAAPSGEPEQAELTLEEALLAPLDAIFRAQVHAARSLLSFLLQMGYPDEKDPENPTKPAWPLKFLHERVREDGTPERHIVQMPALALVPVAPLAVQDAKFKFKMAVTSVTSDYQQYQQDRKKEAKPPWWLIQPRVVRGTLLPEQASTTDARSIEIEINVAKTPQPAGLEKLLTSLTQLGGLMPPPSQSGSGTTPPGSETAPQPSGSPAPGVPVASSRPTSTQ
jgi:hypothetical protein